MEFTKNLKNGSTLREVARVWDSLGPASSSLAEPDPKLSQTGATFCQKLSHFSRIPRLLNIPGIEIRKYFSLPIPGRQKRRQFVYVPESDQIEKSGLSKSPDSDIDLSSVLFRQSTHFIH